MGKLEDSQLLEDLDWIHLQQDVEQIRPETTKEKMLRKIKANPVVPIGCLATAACLCFGLRSMKTGDRKMSQLMMRARVGAQAFTITALIAGVLIAYGNKPQ